MNGAEETPHEKSRPVRAAFECGEDVIMPIIFFKPFFSDNVKIIHILNLSYLTL